MPESVREDTDQCIALTNAGTRCTRPADDDDGFCYQHDESNDTVDLEEEAPGTADRPSTDGDAGASARDAPAREEARRRRDGARSGPSPGRDDGESDATGATGTSRARSAVAAQESGGHTGASDRDRREPTGASDRGDGDPAERLRRHGEAAMEAGRERARAAREWFNAEVTPALRSAREELRRLRSRVADGLSAHRK